ncbi:hypothetical protein PV08_07070 [Exophiala spinifera]|uniref:BTB domain-containing protein n=1 Tax=Exophiala spinifera TaxID=91928 RepID=A0A0D2B5T1_9EURO|nr:uncharacterized protein PV08_07070 [Exophiala spinifera]KIW14288.1 hypothetical protein PV08_07070 [Exophiala spinifera]
MSIRTEESDRAVTLRGRETASGGVGRLRLESFFNSPKFSDFAIKVGDREFKVHKIVICGQSDYFDRLFEGKWKEVLEDSSDLVGDDPAAVEAMVRFMYENEYDSSGYDDTDMSPMVFDVLVYQVADKYGVGALKKLSKGKFDRATSICWEMDDFPRAVAQVYSSPECEELRDTIARVSSKHIDKLTMKNNFFRVLQETTGFAADVVRRMVKGANLQGQTQCPNCGEEVEF